MNKILIATDGSRGATEAVEFGLDLAAEQGAAPIFVHVAPALDQIPIGGIAPIAAVPHELSETDRGRASSRRLSLRKTRNRGERSPQQVFGAVRMAARGVAPTLHQKVEAGEKAPARRKERT